MEFQRTMMEAQRKESKELLEAQRDESKKQMEAQREESKKQMDLEKRCFLFCCYCEARDNPDWVAYALAPKVLVKFRCPNYHCACHVHLQQMMEDQIKIGNWNMPCILCHNCAEPFDDATLFECCEPEFWGKYCAAKVP